MKPVKASCKHSRRESSSILAHRRRVDLTLRHHERMSLYRSQGIFDFQQRTLGDSERSFAWVGIGQNLGLPQLASTALTRYQLAVRARSELERSPSCFVPRPRIRERRLAGIQARSPTSAASSREPISKVVSLEGRFTGCSGASASGPRVALVQGAASEQGQRASKRRQPVGPCEGRLMERSLTQAGRRVF